MTGNLSSMIWGLATDTPIPADYDGDGRTDVAIYRGGQWWILQRERNSASVRQFGLDSDTPLPFVYVR
jgi:hypothetical protein